MSVGYGSDAITHTHTFIMADSGHPGQNIQEILGRIPCVMHIGPENLCNCLSTFPGINITKILKVQRLHNHLLAGFGV